MICVSIAERDLEQCLRAVKGIEFAEIRIDRIARPNVEVIRRIFSGPARFIATCRPGSIGDQKKFTLLRAAVSAGACFVDIELEWQDNLRAALIGIARAAGCKVIISHHDFEKTPGRADLDRTLRKCFEAGADIAKIACRVRRIKDNARLLGLLDSRRPLVVVGLGNQGRITRIVAPLVGSHFTYASLRPGKEIAAGQLDYGSLRKIIKRLKNV